MNDSGATNMLNRSAVIQTEEALGLLEKAQWIESHPGNCSQGWFRGFVVELEEGK